MTLTQRQFHRPVDRTSVPERDAAPAGPKPRQSGGEAALLVFLAAAAGTGSLRPTSRKGLTKGARTDSSPKAPLSSDSKISSSSLPDPGFERLDRVVERADVLIVKPVEAGGIAARKLDDPIEVFETEIDRVEQPVLGQDGDLHLEVLVSQRCGRLGPARPEARHLPRTRIPPQATQTARIASSSSAPFDRRRNRGRGASSLGRSCPRRPTRSRSRAARRRHRTR